MHILRFLAAGLFLALAMLLFSSNRAESKETARVSPVLVELFTSEGCSSCPPADALLIRLERLQPVSGAKIIVLSQHVDYWNRLGWTDPFSSGLFSRRQSDYADALGRDGVYTPQMIVDGQAEFVGSDASRAQQAIARAAAQPKAPLAVSFTCEANSDRGRIHIEFGSPPVGLTMDNSEVILALSETNLSSSVPRGENSGRNLQHTGVVRLLRALGTVAKGKHKFDEEVKLPPSWRKKNLAAVVFLQERQSRRILGAEMAWLVER